MLGREGMDGKECKQRSLQDSNGKCLANRRGVKFKELRDNIWLFEFSNEADKRRILKGRPWTFDKQMLVINEYDGNILPSQLDFNQSPFWVQVHNMSLVCMNKSVGQRLGHQWGHLRMLMLQETEGGGEVI